MPKATFFDKLGLFTRPGFLPADICAAWASSAHAAPGMPATIRLEGNTNEVREEVRRTIRAKVSAEVVASAHERLRALIPDLEHHFGVTLTDCEPPQFLTYTTGGYYRLHRDSGAEPGAETAGRQVSIVVFLNPVREEPEPGSYGGGALTLYGLVDDPGWASYGFAVDGEPGLLVAFRSDLSHEVTPVTHGARYTIATWFY